MFDWLWSIANHTGVVETLVAGFIVLVLVWFWLRASRHVERVRSRALLQDYLLGVEQALHGDLDGAHARLERVLQADPENHYARLLLGKVLAERGEPAAAHKHHLVLAGAFLVESAENALDLARALQRCGRPGEAADAAERVLREDPQNAAALELTFRARLQAGDHEAAATLAPRLLNVRRSPEHAAAVRQDIASVLAEVGMQRLRRGDAASAQKLLDRAALASPHEPSVRLLAARLEVASSSAAAVTRRLLADASSTGNAPLAVAASPSAALPTSVLGGASAHVPPWLRAIAPLLPAGRWRCSSCGQVLKAAEGRCPRCTAEGLALVDEPLLFTPVDAPGHVADAIEANTAHVRRTVRAALDADTAADSTNEATARLRQAVLELGERGVSELLAAATQGDEGRSATAIALLQAIGPAVTPALFASAEAMEDRRLLPDGGAIAHVVGRVVQGFDRSALPHIEALFASARPNSRNILIDYFLGLADPAQFRVVLERFPPLEILHRLNKIDRAVLLRFLQAIPEDSFVATVLLLEPTFYRDEDVLAAIPFALHPSVLERVLVQRGPSRALTSDLLRGLADDALRLVADRVLRAYGPRVQDDLLSAFVDRDRDAAVRSRIGDLLAVLGASAVERLCGSFGPEPAALDDDLRSVLVRMGDGATDALYEAYAQPGWIERVSLGFFGRGGNRRNQIARALTELGTARADGVLQRLREDETDPDLKLRLQQALHQRRTQQERTPGGTNEQTR
jgi:tetratricopeptide (TPR) repeat protein